MSGGAKVGMFSHYVKTTEMVSYSRFQKMYMQMLWKKIMRHKNQYIFYFLASCTYVYLCNLHVTLLLSSACVNRVLTLLYQINVSMKENTYVVSR